MEENENREGDVFLLGWFEGETGEEEEVPRIKPVLLLEPSAPMPSIQREPVLAVPTWVSSEISLRRSPVSIADRNTFSSLLGLGLSELDLIPCPWLEPFVE